MASPLQGEALLRIARKCIAFAPVDYNPSLASHIPLVFCTGMWLRLTAHPFIDWQALGPLPTFKLKIPYSSRRAGGEPSPRLLSLPTTFGT